MSFNADFYAWLTAQAGVTALCGSRIYPVRLAQGADFPCVRFERDANGGVADFDGQSNTTRTDLQTDCIAETLDAATALADALRSALKNHTGALGSKHVYRTDLITEFDTWEDRLAGGRYRVSQAWTLWHN